MSESHLTGSAVGVPTYAGIEVGAPPLPLGKHGPSPPEGPCLPYTTMDDR